ncbi:MAG: hypothetical protein CVT92_12900 [Bacteroidetes bacterium HGW-Bacteroidetes-1]|jgi:DNA-binding MarR family transcriptional regulator|nr:MAG: hypothetical protein CVT92_12900 [Bacteroidetes bacterium HGW-Bacteroidetes-1]
MKYNFDTSFGNLTQRISKSLGFSLASKLTNHGISITQEQWCVISMLYFQKQATQTEIGLFLGYDNVKVLRLIARLEKAGIIERNAGSIDRRFKIVNLSGLGKEYYIMIEPHAKMTLEEATKGLSSEETDLCVKILKKISNNLEETNSV